MPEDDDNHDNDDYENDHDDVDDNDYHAGADHDDKITWKALVDPAIPIAHTSDALDGDDIEDMKIT